MAHPAPMPVLPTRKDLLGTPPAAPARPAVPRHDAPTVVERKHNIDTPPPPTKSAPGQTVDQVLFRNLAEQMPGRTLEERLGPIGVVVSAILVCAVAWLVTWKLF